MEEFFKLWFTLFFIIKYVYLYFRNENKKKYAEVQRSLSGKNTQMDERKKMFIKELNDKEKYDDINLMFFICPVFHVWVIMSCSVDHNLTF